MNGVDKETYLKVLERAISFIAYKPRSQKEVSDRLDKYFDTLYVEDSLRSSLRTEILNELVEIKLLDDYQFARTYVLDRTSSRKAPSKQTISTFLYKKGVSRDAIDAALADISKDYEATSLDTVIEKKMKILRKYDAKTAKTKLIQYLLGKGYSLGSIYGAIDTKFNLK